MYISNELNSASRDSVGDAKSSPSFKFFSCLLPFAQVRPLIVPVQFSLVGLTDSKSSLFSVLVKSVGSCGSTTGLFVIAHFSIGLNYLYIAVIALSLNSFIPLLADIWLNISLVAVYR